MTMNFTTNTNVNISILKTFNLNLKKIAFESISNHKIAYISFMVVYLFQLLNLLNLFVTVSPILSLFVNSNMVLDYLVNYANPMYLIIKDSCLVFIFICASFIIQLTLFIIFTSLFFKIQNPLFLKIQAKFFYFILTFVNPIIQTPSIMLLTFSSTNSFMASIPILKIISQIMIVFSFFVIIFGTFIKLKYLFINIPFLNYNWVSTSMTNIYLSEIKTIIIPLCFNISIIYNNSQMMIVALTIIFIFEQYSNIFTDSYNNQIFRVLFEIHQFVLQGYLSLIFIDSLISKVMKNSLFSILYTLMILFVYWSVDFFKNVCNQVNGLSFFDDNIKRNDYFIKNFYRMIYKIDKIESFKSSFSEVKLMLDEHIHLCNTKKCYCHTIKDKSYQSISLKKIKKIVYFIIMEKFESLKNDLDYKIEVFLLPYYINIFIIKNYKSAIFKTLEIKSKYKTLYKSFTCFYCR